MATFQQVLEARFRDHLAEVGVRDAVDLAQSMALIAYNTRKSTAKRTRPNPASLLKAMPERYRTLVEKTAAEVELDARGIVGSLMAPYPAVRRELWWVIRTHPDYRWAGRQPTYAFIGKLFGMDHSTVLQALSKRPGHA